jgi:hypothetical protein
MRRSIIGLALGLTLIAPSLTTRAIAGGPFDGVYGGQQKTTVNNNAGYCQNLDHPVRLSIVNGVVSYPWGRGMLQATVTPDGSFFTEQPGIMVTRGSSSYQLKGRINLGTLEADVGGTACAVHLSLRKM